MENNLPPEQNNNVYPLEILHELFKTSGFIILNKIAIKMLGLVPAVMLGNYMDKYKYFSKQYPDNDGWFYLVHEKIMDELGISEGTVRKYKKELCKKGIIKTEMRGIPAKEYIKIDFECLGLEVQNLYPLTYQKHKGYISNNKISNNKENINISLSPKRTKKKPPLQERNEQYLPIVEKLSEIIKTNKNISHTTIQKKKWSNEIRRLIEENKISLERIHASLDWYSKHIGEEYTPVIESGESLRIKFERLEAAMTRTHSGNKKPNMIISDGRKWYLKSNGNYYDRKGELYK